MKFSDPKMQELFCDVLDSLHKTTKFVCEENTCDEDKFNSVHDNYIICRETFIAYVENKIGGK